MLSLLIPLLLAGQLLLDPGEPPSLPTIEPGPHAVGRWDWQFDDLELAVPGSGGSETMLVEHYGTFRYPALAEGELTPGIGRRALPFVVFAHGRFQGGPSLGSNHLQAGYLLDHLASWGFAVASVNLDVVGQYATPSAVGQRGRLIGETVDEFQALFEGGGLPVPALAIDFSRLAFVGHSRGGEGCIKAWLQAGDKERVKAIATIAPTDFSGDQLVDVPYLSLYGSKDGDVNNGWPIYIHDRATGGAPKGFEYVEGANHFYFTDSLVFSAEGQPLITREQHHDVARACITWFLLTRVKHGQPRPFSELADSPLLAPITDEVGLQPMYAVPEALVVDDFQDAPLDVNTNSLGMPVLGESLTVFAEEGLKAPPETLYHETRGLHVQYAGGPEFTPLVVEMLPPGTDVSAYTHLSFRVLQRRGSALNPPGLPQDLQVVLGDGSGKGAAVLASAWGGIPWPIAHQGPAFPTKSVLRTVRIPLRAFSALEPELDLTDLAQVAFFFDQTPSGELRLDDIAFTR